MNKNTYFPRWSTDLSSFFVWFILAQPCLAQDIEPRRWSHLPLGGNFGGLAYAYTEGDIFLNPVLRIEDGDFEMNTAALKYIHAFELLGKSARIDLLQMYQSGSWSGLVNGTPAAIDREGWADTTVRLAVNLYGAPPLEREEFIEYRKATQTETIVGAGLVMTLPTGEYFEDKLINLGANRYSFTPQFGVVHTRGKWTMELSTSVTFYTDNDEFFNGRQLEEDPLFIGQGHLIYNFMPGLWLGASAGYGYGGESTIDQVSADDRKGNLGFGLSAGIPVNRNFGFKISYIGIRTQEPVGSDNDTFTISCSLQW
jgi:Putative MetA-pathway of phenol degradation